MPLELLTVRIAGKILQHLGQVEEIEDPMVEGKVIRPFIRARVTLDIQYPLFTGCWIPRKNLSRIWIFVKYERLQDLCFKCGVIGHEQKACKKERVMSSFCEDAYRYGPRVGVPPAKSIKTILEEQARRNKKIPEETSQASEATEETDDNERCTEEVISERERKENKD